MEFLVSQNLSFTQPGVVEVHGFSSHLKNLLAPFQKPKFKSALVTSLVCLVFESFFQRTDWWEREPGNVVKVEVKPAKEMKKSSSPRRRIIHL